MNARLNQSFLFLFVLVLLAVPLGTSVWSRMETSAYYERRVLAELPEAVPENFWDGSFGGDFESWYADHVPGRTQILKSLTALQMYIFQRPVVNGIIMNADNVLLPFADFQTTPEAEYQNQANIVAEDFAQLRQHIQNNNGRLLVIGLPEQRVYFQDYAPDALGDYRTEMTLADNIFIRTMREHEIDFLDMREIYQELGHPDEFYSRVDHHYTYYGAYAAYRAIMQEWARQGKVLPVLTEDDIYFQFRPNDYLGTRNRALYNLWPNRERAVIASQREPVNFTRMDNGISSKKPLFVLPGDASQPATYDIYMGGDFAETILQTSRPELPNLLIFGDSFTNALETLLYASFNETRSLDPRHYHDKSLKDYITDYQPDMVLCVISDMFYYADSEMTRVWTE